MAAISHDDAEPDMDSQQALAQSLIDCMGRESAIHICKVNGWIGVLQILTGEKPPLSRNDV